VGKTSSRQEDSAKQIAVNRTLSFVAQFEPFDREWYESSMRFLLAFFLAALILPAHLFAASAEQRTFIIANSPDAYGVDHCLAHGAACGAAAAAAYCQSKEFSSAASYRKIDRQEITGAVPASGACGRTGCEEFVAIECKR
jgi:hypothetical protein